MQARSKIVKILVVALVVSLVLVACGGGSTGSTWFNLPSVKVQVQPDGVMRVWGFSVGDFPQPALLQQLQSANIQRLEVRVGYNGIFIFANGEALPYVAWDEASVDTLQAILPQLPNVPNAQMIANALPWLRTIGLGAQINLPAQAAQLDIPRWSGETSITPSTEASEFGQIVLGSLIFDPEGQATIEGVSVSTLEQATGMSIPLALDGNTLAILQALGTEGVRVHVQPDGIDLSLSNGPLPGIAWDAQHLDTLAKYLPAFVADEATLASVNQALPLLTSADILVGVSFTGEPLVDTELPQIEVTLTDDGSVQLFGITLMAQAVPVDLINNLQAADVQQLAVSLQSNGLFLAANGQTLPTITWTDASLPTVVEVAGAIMGNEALLSSVVDIALGIGPNLRVNVPLAEGATAVEVPAEQNFAITPTEADPQAPTLRLTLAVDNAGNITTLGGIATDDLAGMGSALPTLPAETIGRLTDAGISQVQLSTDPGTMNVQFDGNNVIALNYDEPSLLATLDLATPFVGDSPLTDPAVDQLLRQEIMPLIPTADVNVTINLP
jgi:hypothetical protein